jgi:hypothetical protein
VDGATISIILDGIIKSKFSTLLLIMSSHRALLDPTMQSALYSTLLYNGVCSAVHRLVRLSLDLFPFFILLSLPLPHLPLPSLSSFNFSLLLSSSVLPLSFLLILILILILSGEYIEFFGGDTDIVMKEYAFLPSSQLDPLRDDFMPSKVVKRFLTCIEGARKEQLDMDAVIDVSTLCVSCVCVCVYMSSVCVFCFVCVYVCNLYVCVCE